MCFKAGQSPIGVTAQAQQRTLRGISQEATHRALMEKWEPGIHPVLSKFRSLLPFCAGDVGIETVLAGGSYLFKGNRRRGSL